MPGSTDRSGDGYVPGEGTESPGDQELRQSLPEAQKGWTARQCFRHLESAQTGCPVVHLSAYTSFLAYLTIPTTNDAFHTSLHSRMERRRLENLSQSDRKKIIRTNI